MYLEHSHGISKYVPPLPLNSAPMASPRWRINVLLNLLIKVYRTSTRAYDAVDAHGHWRCSNIDLTLARCQLWLREEKQKHVYDVRWPSGNLVRISNTNRSVCDIECSNCEPDDKWNGKLPSIHNPSNPGSDAIAGVLPTQAPKNHGSSDLFLSDEPNSKLTLLPLNALGCIVRPARIIHTSSQTLTCPQVHFISQREFCNSSFRLNSLKELHHVNDCMENIPLYRPQSTPVQCWRSRFD